MYFNKGMYICLCHAISERDIRLEVASGVRTFATLQEKTGCSDCCGCCETDAHICLQRALKGDEEGTLLNFATTT